MADPTLTISVRDLAALVAPVKVHASPDDMIPVLNAVRFEVRNGFLVAIATDRYRVAIHRRPTESKGFEATLALGDLARLLQIFKPTRGEDPELVLTVVTDDGKSWLQVEQGGSLGFDFVGASLRFPLVTGDYPNVMLLFDAALTFTGEQAPAAPVSPRYLAAFANAPVGNREPLIVRTTAPGKPIIVSAGEDFIALLMPTRAAREEAEIPAHWAATLAPEKSKPAPKKRATRKKAAA